MQAPFETVDQAIGFYLHNNPARQRFFNITEPDIGRSNVADDFTGHSPRDLWALILQSIRRTLTFHTPQEGQVFTRFYLDIDEEHFVPMAQICAEAGVSKSKGYRMLADVLESLGREMRKRRLIPERQSN
jgi:hypothetical protein